MPIGLNGERLPYTGGNLPFNQSDLDLAGQLLGRPTHTRNGVQVPQGLNLQNMVEFARTPAGRSLIQQLGGVSDRWA